MYDELGLYLKTIRIYSGFTKKYICDQCGVKTQFVSRVENSKEPVLVERDIKEKWLSALNVEFKENYNVNVKYVAIIEEFFEAYLEYNSRRMKEIYDELNEDNQIIHHSAFSIYVLLKFTYRVVLDFDNYDVQLMYSILDKTADQLGKKYNDLYLLICGVYHMHYQVIKWQESEKYLCKTIKRYHSDERIMATAYHHLCELEMRKGNAILALKYNKKAANLFQSNNVYKRYVQELSTSGVIYLNLGESRLAYAVFDQAAKLASLINCNQLMAMNYANIAFSHIIMKDYDKVVEYVKKTLHHSSECKEVYVYICYAYYKMNNEELFNQWIEKGLKECHNIPAYKRLLKLGNDLINNNIDEDVILEKFILDSKNINSIKNDAIKIVYRELVESKKARNKFKEALNYLEDIEKLSNIFCL